MLKHSSSLNLTLMTDHQPFGKTPMAKDNLEEEEIVAA
jgi:hypothetical protein